MGVIRGLKAIQEFNAPRESSGPKATWFKIKGGQTARVRFLQEMDPDSVNYSSKNGCGFIAVEHSNPANYQRKALCSLNEEGRCWACEQHRQANATDRENYKGGWKQKGRLYINALVQVGLDDEPFVAVLSQGTGPKQITPTVIEYATEYETITNRWFKVKRVGDGNTDTSYTALAMDPSDDVNVEEYELFDLDKIVRSVPYEEQEAHYMGGQTFESPATEAPDFAEPVAAGPTKVRW